VGLDSAKIQGYFDKEALSLLKAELDLGTKLGVRGSPSIFINDVSYSGGRAPENFKSAICDAFITPPAGCNQTLSAEGTAASGNCAT
jgi:protein-disulfide isomerase